MSKNTVGPIVSFKSVEDQIKKLEEEHKKKIDELKTSVNSNVDEYLNTILPEIKKMDKCKDCLSFYKEYNKFIDTFEGDVRKTSISFNIGYNEKSLLLDEVDDNQFYFSNIKLKGYALEDVSNFEERDLCSEVLALVPEAYKTFKKMSASLNEISDLTVEKALAYINVVKTLKENLTQRVSLDIEFRLNSDGEMDIICTNPANKVAKAVIESNINDILDEVYTEDVFDEYFDAIGEFLPNSLYRQFQNSFSDLVTNIKLTYPALAYTGFENKLKAKLGIEGI